MTQFTGRSAFVSGGASGIGLAIAKALQAEGAKVTIADIDRQSLTEVCAATGLHGVPLDVSDPVSWDGAKVAAEAEHGPVDLLINNAGIFEDRALADIAPAAFARLISINLCGMFNGIATFAGGMRERGAGHIMNTGSISGIAVIPGIGGYCASKFGVVGMSEALREELAPFGVGVSVLCPAMVRTNLSVSTDRIAGKPTGQTNLSLEKGTPPERIAAIALEGIRNNTLHIFTHPEWIDRIEARHAQLVEDHQALLAVANAVG